MKLILKKLINTCTLCPSQWEGELDDGRLIYIRYRWGYLRVELGPHNITHIDKEFLDNSHTIFDWESEDDFDGIMSLERLVYLTRHILNYSHVLPIFFKLKMWYVRLYYMLFSIERDPWLKLKLNTQRLEEIADRRTTKQ